MIKRITNLVLSETDTQKDVKWNRVLAQKNRLLKNSDWTQLLDSGLVDFSVYEWKEWRTKLKNVHRETHDKLEIVKQKLTELENSQPDKVFREYAGNESIEDYKIQLKKLLYKKYQEKLEIFFIENGPRDSIVQKYEEAVNFLTEKFPKSDSNYYPFITTSPEIKNLSKEEIANSFIDVYKKYMVCLVNVEKIYQIYTKRITNMTKTSERDTIAEEIFSWFGV